MILDLALMVAAAGAIGYGLAWLRPDLDLAHVRTGIVSAAVAAAAACVLALTGGDDGLLYLWAGLAPLAVIDAKTRLLPNEGTFTLIALGVFFGIAAGLGAGADRFAGAALGYGAFWLLGAAWRRWRGIDALGLGDAKLFAAIGAGLGWRALPEVALLGALGGIAFALLARKTRGDFIPFGPALALGAFVHAAFGPLIG